MRTRRMLDKWLSQHLNVLNSGDAPMIHTSNFGKLISTLAPDPKNLTLTKIRGAKALIQELLKTTRLYYPDSFKHLEPIGAHINEQNLSISKVLIATHFALGTKNVNQLESEVSAYDIKKDSHIWFTQL